ncbi:lycopene beta-cyclase CrtY [Croceicoccus sp. BE223]|uniref:lycopene beta-cyclase CrtY n=1 Tax=Croceicoccus sp. BE223 TaxID=2817716 RepID=UPI0028646199|nr:lycopene beta-cyclase CrtY [Croceicoccus sp. BE223]MDR7101385.1 lycopene beta-cyclase [Croceicoccus sp. BE223]
MQGRFDIAIAGAGLAGSLIALTLRARRPDLSVALVDKGESVGGNHVWSFFATDIADADRALVDPLCIARWDNGYDVLFPALERTLPTSYRSVTSERLDAAVRAALPADALFTGRAVASLDPAGLTLADGARIAAGTVIDARGLDGERLTRLSGGWQKFVGAMLECEAPHGLERPVVMDATVDQIDGYRFVYCLPFSPTEVFIEDTYYSDTPDLDVAALTARITDYAAARGWRGTLGRFESGVLPVVTDANFAAFQAEGGEVAQAGVRAGLFQPLTSYSLPDAVRYASALAALPRIDHRSVLAWSRAYGRRHWRRGLFYRLLARMLFRAAEPDQRYRVLQRFYGLDGILIERFYAGASTLADWARVLTGKPPVPMGRAALVLAGIGAPGRLTRPVAPPHPLTAPPATEGMP